MSDYGIPKDCQRQAEPSLDDSLYQRIEMEFAIPVYVTREQQRLLHELFHSILDNPANKPLDGVHWQNAHGPKPIWSQTDAEKLGQTAQPGAAISGPPQWDENTLYFGSTTGSDKEF